MHNKEDDMSKEIPDELVERVAKVIVEGVNTPFTSLEDMACDIISDPELRTHILSTSTANDVQQLAEYVQAYKSAKNEDDASYFLSCIKRLERYLP